MTPSKNDGAKEPTIANLYSQATKLMQDAEAMPRGDKRQETYLTSRRLFENIIEQIERLDLFSDNETIEDVATETLKYFLAPVYLAKVIVSSECSSNRLQTYVRAESVLIDFLRRMSAYKFESDRIDRLLRNNNAKSLISSKASSISLENAVQSRNEKIARYKRAKEIETKLSELNKIMKTSENVDEEIAREYYVHLLRQNIEEAIESLEREVRPALFLERNRATHEGESSSDASASSKTNSKSAGLNRGTITIVKDNIQKQVFGIGYPSRPTVTVDEFISEKMQSGELAFQKHEKIYGNSLQRYAEQPNLRRDQEELSDEEREHKEEKEDPEELERKRRWDEFKDENPRGSGNRHNMG